MKHAEKLSPFALKQFTGSDNWYRHALNTTIEADASLDDGNVRQILNYTVNLGFNYKNNNGNPSYDLTLLSGISAMVEIGRTNQVIHWKFQ